MFEIAVMLTAVDKMSQTINKATSNASQKLEGLANASRNVSKSAFNFGQTSGAFGLGLGAALALPIKAAADLERMNVALKTSFQGNEAAAKQAFETINKFAATTPYELNEVMTGFIKLKNMGLDPSITALTAYGNTASAMGKSLNDMVEAVADAATGEFERLKEFGIKASSQGDKVTFTFQGVKTTVGKNAAEIEKYLIGLGNTKFAGGIQAQSKTFYGQLSTFKDNVTMTMAKVGNSLLPVLNNLFTKLTPIVDKIAAWVEKNPELTATIMKGAAGLVALSLATSATSFAFGGVFKVIQGGSSVLNGAVRTVGWLTDKNKGLGHWVFVARYRMLQLSQFATGSVLPALRSFGTGMASAFTTASAAIGRAFTFIGRSMMAMGRFLLANPIILIIAAIAAAVYLIYRNWDAIKAWFINLWENVKNIFLKAWEWVKNLFLKYHPLGILIKHWDAVKAWFSNIGGWFKKAGSNIVNSVWEGMKAMASKPVEMMKSIVGKVRNLLPFSPAKEGPLRDIHRIKLVETIAAAIKPAPMVRAMSAAVAGVAGLPSPGGVAAMGGGGTVTVNFHINGGGGASGEAFIDSLRRHKDEISRIVRDAVQEANRRKF